MSETRKVKAFWCFYINSHKQDIGNALFNKGFPYESGLSKTQLEYCLFRRHQGTFQESERQNKKPRTNQKDIETE